MSWFTVPTLTLTVSSSLLMLLSKLIILVAAAEGREYKLRSPRGEGFYHLLFGACIQKERLLLLVG